MQSGLLKFEFILHFDLMRFAVFQSQTSPGPVATQFLRSYGLNMETMKDYIEEKMKESTLLKILPQSSDIANLATFLASDYARNMTGSIVVSDSGMLVQRIITEK